MAATTGNTGTGWAHLRQQARTLEAQTETALHTYSQFSTVANIPPKPTEEEKNVEAKIQDLLEKRDSVVSQLGRLLDSEAALTASALKQNNLSLLRDKLSSHRSDLTRLRSSLAEARDRANLLGRVRDDIDAYRAANNNHQAGGGGGSEAAEAEYMLAERGRIDRSNEVADGVLSQAYAVQGDFARQREALASVSRRIALAAGQVPGINALVGRISVKKRRDGIIMGSFVAVCFLVFWFFL